jgi:hypothetical protein
MVAEAAHLLRYGHPGLGLHVDLMSRADTDGVRSYSLWGVNLTPLPLPVRVCVEDSDIGPLTQYRYDVEVWKSERPRWTPMLSLPPACDFMGHPRWNVLWPGASVELISPRSAEASVRNGDRFRFVVFTLFDRPDDSWLQIRVVSPERLVTRAPAVR